MPPRRFLPHDLFISILAVVVIVLVFSSGASGQQSGTRSNRRGGSSGSSGAAGDQGTESGSRLQDISQLRKIMERYLNVPERFARRDEVVRCHDEVDDSYATTIRVIVFAQTASPVFAGNTNIFTFNFTADLAHQQVVNATMGIFIRRPVEHTSLITTWILVYRVRPLPSQERVLVHKRRVTLDQLQGRGQWFTFNMKSYVEGSVSQTNASAGFVIQASDGRGEPLAIVNPQNQSDYGRKPYLEIYILDRSTSLRKRTIDLDTNSME